MKNRFYRFYSSTPIVYLHFTIASIILTELLIMTILFKGTSLYHAMLDALMLSLFIAPALYFLLYKPLIENLSKSKQAEKQLTELNQSLEDRVLERTGELTKVNRLLEAEYTEALQLSEERYKNVIDNMGIGVSVIGPDLKITSANHQMLKWHPKVDFSKNPFCYKVFISEDSQNACEECPVQLTFKEGKVNFAIAEMVIDGQTRSIRIITSPVKDRHGSIVAVTKTVEDVTEQTKYNEDLEQAIRERTSELSEAENRYRSLVQNSSEGIFVIDPFTQKVQEANKQFLALLGYTQQELSKLSLTEFIEADKENIEQYLHLMINEQKEVNIIHQCKRKEGSLIDVEIRASLIQYGKSKVCLVNVRDISERKRAEEEHNLSVMELRKTLYAGIDALVNLAEKRDPYTAGHQKRVAKFAFAIAKEMGLEDSLIESIRIAGTLHDIGKIYVPTDILNKPGQLTEMEMGIIKTHPQVSYEIIAQIPFINNVAEMILQHHERLDGSGYPKGLMDKDILIGAKILGVADVVEAMSSHRPYRPAIGWELALKEIVDMKGIIYDADVVEACLRLSDPQGGYLLKIIEEVL